MDSDLFSSFFGDMSSIAIDWKETPKHHVIYAYLPGLKKEDVKLEVSKGVMEIQGNASAKESEDDQGESGVTWHIRERPVNFAANGVLTRRVSLPSDADVDGMKAAMNDGVLTVTVLKKELEKPRARRVEIEEIHHEGLGKKIVKSIKSIIGHKDKDKDKDSPK